MRIELKDNLDAKLAYTEGYIRRINITDTKIVRLLSGINEQQAEEIKNVLNLINNQGIEELDFNKHEYVIKGKRLGFSDLSKAESVFLIASVADMKSQTLWFHTDITQLTKSTLKKFIKRFYNSEYVNIVYDSDISTAFYKAMVKEAMND